jgi:hypothetical protein
MDGAFCGPFLRPMPGYAEEKSFWKKSMNYFLETGERLSKT